MTTTHHQEHDMPDPDTFQGRTDWTCDAGAALIVEAVPASSGSHPEIHGVIYTCTEHRAAAEKRVTVAGYGLSLEQGAPDDWESWPCGHVTAYTEYAADCLADHLDADEPATS